MQEIAALATVDNHVGLSLCSRTAYRTLIDRVAIHVSSQDIERASLHASRPVWAHIYALPFLSLYPVWAYAYFFKYDDWVMSEEWTFLGCVALGVGHALSFLATKWSASAKAVITSSSVRLPGVILWKRLLTLT